MSLDTFVVIELMLGAALFAVAYRGFTGKWPWEGTR
jgi:hypothetical protein